MLGKFSSLQLQNLKTHVSLRKDRASSFFSFDASTHLRMGDNLAATDDDFVHAIRANLDCEVTNEPAIRATRGLRAEVNDAVVHEHNDLFQQFDR